MIPCTKNAYFVFIESNTSGTGYEFIRRAYQNGYYPVLISDNISRYDISNIKADYIYADTNNAISILNVCHELSKRAPIAGLMSTSEYYVPIAAEVAQSLLLPSPSSSAVKACRNKKIQRKAMLECGLTCPRYEVISCMEELNPLSFKYPVVIKPISGSGSVGVRLCSDATELGNMVYSYFSSNQKNERGINFGSELLIEEYIEGSEFSAEVFGRRILGFTAKHLGAHPCFVETGHDFAVAIPESIRNKAELAIISLCEYMGLNFGAKHVEFRIHNDEIYIIEVNPRLAGGHIPTIMEYACGKKIIDQIIDVYTGEKQDIDLGNSISPVSIRFIIPYRNGIIRKAELRDGVDKNILEIKMYKQQEDFVFLHGDFRDRIGHIIFKTNHLPADVKIGDLFNLIIE